MKVIGVIPARYSSSRFPGKPLADICGRPMVWWVYNQVKKVGRINEVYVATDSEEIVRACQGYGINCLMTSEKHLTSTSRVHEISCKIAADLYVCINGDEPLVDPDVIDAVIPDKLPDSDFYVSNLMTKILDPVEAVDFTNIKVVTDTDSNALFMSRSPIPYPKSSMDYKYYKHVGVLVYTKNALDFFVGTQKGKMEMIEDINELRFIEHGKKLKMVEVDAASLSVDTFKDIEHIRAVVAGKISTGEIRI